MQMLSQARSQLWQRLRISNNIKAGQPVLRAPRPALTATERRGSIMANAFRTCTVNDCNKYAINGRGWCAGHYHRWLNHGDPLAGVAAKGDGARFLGKVLSSEPRTDCIFWPYGKNGQGYGQLKIEGKSKLAHRVVCEAVHGAAPAGKSYARHLCGNGHLGCVNPRHLAWGSAEQNWQDMRGHKTAPQGERHSKRKLTERQVREIRSLQGSASQSEIADIFGITRSGVQSILRRRSWRHVE